MSKDQNFKTVVTERERIARIIFEAFYDRPIDYADFNNPGYAHSRKVADKATDAILATRPTDPGGASGGKDHSKDFQLMLMRIIQRHRNGRDLTETLEGALDLLKRKGSLSVFRESAASTASSGGGGCDGGA